MLSENEFSLLYKIISNKYQTFEQISLNIESCFNNESNILIIKTLLILIDDNSINIHQKIISYYIIHHLHKKAKISNLILLPLVLDKLKKNENKIETNFLVDVFFNKIEYNNKTIEKYIEQNCSIQKLNINQLIIYWEKFYNDNLKDSNININIDCIKRPFIPKDKANSVIINNKIDNKINYKDLNLNFYKSNYMQLFDINNKLFENEPIWILPNLSHNFIWENNKG